MKTSYAGVMEREHTVEASDGTGLFYRLTQREAGDTVLVMLHGLASNSTRWSEFVGHLNLSKPWDLLRIDLRGHGHSRYRGRLSHQLWCEDLATVLAHHGYRRAILVGHSLGAQLALHFADYHPQTVAGLILIDPLFPDSLQGNLAGVARFRGFLPPLVRLVLFINRLGVYRRHFPELDLYQLDRQTRELLQASAGADIARLYARPLGDIKNLPTAIYLQDLYEVTRPLPPLAEIDTPALVLLSQGVGLSDLEANRQHIAQLRRADTAIIDADHWLLTEKPVEARQAIEQWCERLELG